MGLLAIIGVVILGVVAWYWYLVKGKKLPPGPNPLPIVGNMFQVDGTKPFHTFQQLSKKYGPVISLRFGRLLTVVVSSPELAKLVFEGFTVRPVGLSVMAQEHNKFSLGFLPVGESKWKEIRRICKDRVFGSQSLEGSQKLRLEKMQLLLNYVQKCCNDGRPVNIRDASFTSALNTLSAILFSNEDNEFESIKAFELREAIEGLATIVSVPSYADYFPVLEPLDPLGVKRMSDYYMEKLVNLMKHEIDERLVLRKTDAPKPNDVLETLLNVVLGEDYKFSFMDITHFLMDLYAGGTDTMAITVEWTMAQLLLHPDILSKAKQELRNVVGDRNIIQDSDIAKLPYLQAVVKEVFRYVTIGPLLVGRTCDEDMELKGYRIPKYTQLLVNEWAICRDPSVWPNPESFDPDRFLNSKIDVKGTNYELTPFGAGKRICPGLPLAHRVIHITVALLIHNFDWKFARGESERNGTAFTGLSLRRESPLLAIPLPLSY